jgi:hypothetical protein
MAEVNPGLLAATVSERQVAKNALEIYPPLNSVDITAAGYWYQADGAFHSLNERFTVLSDAQVYFPSANSLSECMNWHALYRAVMETIPAMLGGVVAIPSGRAIVRKPTAASYLLVPVFNEEQALPTRTSDSYPVIFWGVGSKLSEIYLDTDTGSTPNDNFFIQCGTSPGTQTGQEAGTRYSSGVATFGGGIRGLSIIGPAAGLSTSAHLNEPGCNISCLLWGSRFWLEDVDISGWYNGMDFVGDHTTFRKVRIRGCFNSVYVAPDSTTLYGDVHWDDECFFWNNRFSCVYVSAGGHVGTWHIAGRMFMSRSPYAFFKEADPAVDGPGWVHTHSFLSGVRAEALFLEEIGNCCMWDDNLRVNGAPRAFIDFCVFDGITPNVFSDSFKIAGRDRCLVQVNQLNGGSWTNVIVGGLSGMTLAAFELGTVLVDFLVEGDIERFLTRCASAGAIPVRFGNGSTSVETLPPRFRVEHTHGDTTCGPYKGRFYPVYNGSVIAAGDLVTSKFAGVEKSFYTSDGYVVGLARQAVTGLPSTQIGCCVAEEGLSLPFNAGAEGVTAQTPVKMSKITNGALQTARSVSDEMLGYCTTAGFMRMFSSAKSAPRVTRQYRNVRSDASAATYLVAKSDNNSTIRFPTGSALTLTLPATLPMGFSVKIIQGGAGAISWTPASGATINTVADSATQTGGIGKWFEAEVESNPDLASAVWTITGYGLIP